MVRSTVLFANKIPSVLFANNKGVLKLLKRLFSIRIFLWTGRLALMTELDGLIAITAFPGPPL